MNAEDAADAERLSASADRLDSLADAAELMGDSPTAARFRSAASNRRLEAMSLFDT